MILRSERRCGHRLQARIPSGLLRWYTMGTHMVAPDGFPRSTADSADRALSSLKIGGLCIHGERDALACAGMMGPRSTPGTALIRMVLFHHDLDGSRADKQGDPDALRKGL